jgi:chromosome segregation ATPase
MVIKYATSEKEVIHLKKIREENDKKIKDLIKDKESLNVRIKGLSNDKLQLMSSLDKKVVEISSLQRDYEKLNNELKDRDSKWKQTLNKLKEESNAHNETKTKLESMAQKMSEMKEESEGLRKELHNLLHSNEDNEIDLSVNNDNALTKIEQLTNEIENYKKKMSVYIQENHSLTTKVQALERERLDHEQSVSKLKETLNELQIEINDYVSKLRDMDQLKQQLDREKELVSHFQKESERLKSSNNELRAEMDSCRHKEGELLEFTERLTAKTVHLQSEHNILEQKSVMLKDDVERLQKQCEDLSKDNSNLNQTIDQLKESHQKEVALLAKKLAEKTKMSDDLKNKVEEFENEIRVNKRRHVSSVKELNRELLAMKKRLEHFDGQSLSLQSDCVSIGSRTSSSNSLTDAISGQNHINSSTNNSQQSQQKSSVTIPPTVLTESVNSSTPATNLFPEVDKQVLIDRILRLQKSLAKRNEKIDFFEEHNQQLIEEMKKKSKLIQYYILREETGALSTSSMDDHKVSLFCLKLFMKLNFKFSLICLQ